MYPAATPIWSVSDPGGAEIIGYGVVGGTSVADPPYFVTDETHRSITYLGGWSPDTDSEDPDYDPLPMQLQRAICWAAKAIANPVTSFGPIPDGATSATVGDVSVTWGDGGAPAQSEVEFDAGLVKRWKRRLDLVA
jgi:hypothetical protein